MDAKKLTILSLVILMLADQAHAGSGLRRLHYLRKGQYAAEQAAAAAAAAAAEANANAAADRFLAGSNTIIATGSVIAMLSGTTLDFSGATTTVAGSMLTTATPLPSDIVGYLAMVSIPVPATNIAPSVSLTPTTTANTSSNTGSSAVVVPDNGTLALLTQAGPDISANVVNSAGTLSIGTPTSTGTLGSVINAQIVGGIVVSPATTATGTMQIVKSGTDTASLTSPSALASSIGMIVVNEGTLVITYPSALQSYVGRLIVGTGAKVIIGTGPSEVTIGPGTWDLSQFYSNGIITPVVSNQ